MRTIGVITVSRSDYGIYLPVLRAIQRDPELRLHLIASGTHLSSEFGHTVDAIVEDGFAVADRVEMLLSSDSPGGVAKSMGLGTIGFAESYSRFRPDLLLALGDRFEMHAAVVAAAPFRIPIAHIHGGELTFGALDDAFRHSITKLSHLHFTSTQEYARRVIQLGEEPWRVTVSGAPGLDNLASIQWLSREDLERRLGLKLGSPPLLVTYHPVTLDFDSTGTEIANLLAALAPIPHPIVFSAPNADTGGRALKPLIHEFVAMHPNSAYVENLGTQAYFSLMRIAAAMAGNSSSGILEAASFSLPVVNIGSRQAGRIRGRNVIDTGSSLQEIQHGLQTALYAGFRASLQDPRNPYGDGCAAERIVGRLRYEPLGDRLLIKRFHDQDSPSS